MTTDTTTPTNAVPAADAVAALLAQTATGPGLVRTGQALVTIRNADGKHLVYRFRAREPWEDRRGVMRPGDGYWLDCREGTEWTAVGIATTSGEIRPTQRSTSDAVIQYGARLVLEALRAGTRTLQHRNRTYTLHVEDRCGRCGRELSDPVSIDRGMGPECYGKATGSKNAR